LLVIGPRFIRRTLRRAASFARCSQQKWACASFCGFFNGAALALVAVKTLLSSPHRGVRCAFPQHYRRSSGMHRVRMVCNAPCFHSRGVGGRAVIVIAAPRNAAGRTRQSSCADDRKAAPADVVGHAGML